MFWNRAPKTTGDEHAAAVARTSEDWAGEIQRLRAELDENAVKRAAAVVESGRATLDNQHARAADLAAQIRTLDTRREIVEAAISAAVDRQADAETDEARKRLTLRLRTYHASLATWAASRANVVDAERALAEAVQQHRAATAGLGIADMYGDLLGAGVTTLAVDTLQGLTGDELRAEAERLRALATTASVAGPEGEQIGVLPLTPKQIEVSAINAAQPEVERRRALGVLGAQLHDARAHASRLASDRTSHAADREKATARVAELEHQAAALEAKEEVPA